MRDQLRATLAANFHGDAAHDLAHMDRVWANAQAIMAGEPPCNTTVVLCACYLHDLVSLPKDSPDRARASTLAAEQALPILQTLGLSPSDIAATQHAITAHSFSAGIAPLTPEAKITQDADRIEALGAIGIARCFAVSGGLNRPLWDGHDPFAANRPLDDSTYAVDHFAAKLLTLPDTMQTDTGRRIAQARADVMRQFLDQLAGEMGSAPSGW